MPAAATISASRGSRSAQSRRRRSAHGSSRQSNRTSTRTSSGKAKIGRSWVSWPSTNSTRASRCQRAAPVRTPRTWAAQTARVTAMAGRMWLPASNQMALSVIGADSPMRISAAARRGADSRSSFMSHRAAARSAA